MLAGRIETFISSHPLSPLVMHDLGRMPYRPQKRRASLASSRSGNGTHHRGSYAARLAIARSTARRPAGRDPSSLLAVALGGVVSVPGIISAGVIAPAGRQR